MFEKEITLYCPACKEFVKVYAERRIIAINMSKKDSFTETAIQLTCPKCNNGLAVLPYKR